MTSNRPCYPRLFVAGWLLLVLTTPGCKKGPKLVPVEGRVTMEGKPVKSLVVTFSAIGKTGGVGAHGFTDESGRFTLSNARGGTGAEAGEYFISLMPSAAASKQGDPLDVIGKASDSRIPGIYMDPGQTQLRATIPEAGGTVEINLTKNGVGATAKTASMK